jgi:hypothetical protein
MYGLAPDRVDCHSVTNSVRLRANMSDRSLLIQGLARCLSLVTKNEWDALGLKTQVEAIENTI